MLVEIQTTHNEGVQWFLSFSPTDILKARLSLMQRWYTKICRNQIQKAYKIGFFYVKLKN